MKLKQILNMMEYIMNPFVFRLAVLDRKVIRQVEDKYYKELVELCKFYGIKFSDTADFVGKKASWAGYFRYDVVKRGCSLCIGDDKSIGINPDTKAFSVVCHELGHFFTLSDLYKKIQLEPTTSIEMANVIANTFIETDIDGKEKIAEDYMVEIFKRYIDPMDGFVLRVTLETHTGKKPKDVYGRFWFFRKGFIKNVKWVWNFAGNN